MADTKKKAKDEDKAMGTPQPKPEAKETAPETGIFEESAESQERDEIDDSYSASFQGKPADPFGRIAKLIWRSIRELHPSNGDMSVYAVGYLTSQPNAVIKSYYSRGLPILISAMLEWADDLSDEDMDDAVDLHNWTIEQMNAGNYAAKGGGESKN